MNTGLVPIQKQTKTIHGGDLDQGEVVYLRTISTMSR